MAQAKTLTSKELNLLLLYVTTRKHKTRDRAIVLMTHWAGMCIGEVAATKIVDMRALDGTVKSEINLSMAQTKGRHERTDALADKL